MHISLWNKGLLVVYLATVVLSRTKLQGGAPCQFSQCPIINTLRVTFQ